MPAAAPERTSLSFGHYAVLVRPDGWPEELGRGAMGITYKALDTALERHVALKVINSDCLAGDDMRQRFLREARAAAQLRHPNVAGVFHLGNEGGTHFYAMEFIDGETLEARVQRLGPLPCGEVLDLAAQAAAALAAAHAAQLVHRDIKPANLMAIRESRGRLLLKVIDFGLAKSAIHGARDATLTIGGFVGTPHFASPEQLEEKDLDIRSDIYSLGATLWYLLTGQTLYTGSLARVMIGHISETPAFDRLIAPPSLRALLRRLLAKNVADRPQTPEGLLTEIQVAASQLGDPAFLCRLDAVASSTGCTFTLQELLRVRRELPAAEALPILRKIAEALDSVDTHGRAQVDLSVQAIALDFPEQPTVIGRDLMHQPVGQWPVFGLKFRDAATATIGLPATMVVDQATLCAMPAAPREEGYLQRLAGIASELLGGRLRAENSAAPGEFAPLAALTEEGNVVLQAALTPGPVPVYSTGAEFLAALQIVEGVSIGAMPATAVLARTQRMGPSLPAPTGRSRKRPLVAAALVAVAIVGIAGASIFILQPPEELHHAKAGTPAKAAASPRPLAGGTSVAKAAEPPASVAPAPAPVAATPAPLDPDQRLKIAIGEGAELEAAAYWNGALASAVRLVRDFPNYEKGPSRLEDLISRLNSKGEFSRHWAAYEPIVGEAAELGSGHAVYLQGLAAKPHDPNEAISLFKKAADAGVHEAMTEVGLAYFNGQGAPKDLSEAERWFQKASDYGDSAGTLLLGEAYLSGKGVKQDYAKALKFIQDAADHRSGDARNLLGKLYLYGRAGLVANKATAVEYFRQAKDLKCPEAFYNLGMIVYSAKGPLATPARAAGLFEGGAKLGHSLSMFYYARCLDEGSGVPMSKADAQMWYLKAIGPLKKEAEEGSRAAMVCYAMALDQALGIDRNLSEARRWYARAAALGDPMAADWCVQNHVAFQPPPGSLPTSTAPSPRKVFLGKRTGNTLP
jgi:TPR repeat protein